MELAIIMVLSNVKDERNFFIVNFMKFKLYNCLTIPFGFGSQNVCLGILQARHFPITHNNLKVREGEIAL
jgi:hypothetical protein